MEHPQKAKGVALGYSKYSLTGLGGKSAQTKRQIRQDETKDRTHVSLVSEVNNWRLSAVASRDAAADSVRHNRSGSLHGRDNSIAQSR